VRLALAVATLALGGCVPGDRGPEIARTPDLEWPLPLAERFPPGTPDAAIETELKRQGFEVLSGANTATISWDSFPCAYKLDAKWTLDAAGKVTSTSGASSNACT
jgi:hypothetical protein